jgi:hypothetical protein
MLSITAKSDPSCAKTRLSTTPSQQLIRTVGRKESLLRYSICGRINLAFRTDQNGFHTAWTPFRHGSWHGDRGDTEWQSSKVSPTHKIGRAIGA